MALILGLMLSLWQFLLFSSRVDEEAHSFGKCPKYCIYGGLSILVIPGGMISIILSLKVKNGISCYSIGALYHESCCIQLV